MSIAASLTVISICQIILTAMMVAAIAGLIFVVFWFKNFIDRKVNEVMDRVQPVVDRALTISEQAKDTVETVNTKVDAIMTRIESTTNNVTGSVDSIMEKANTAAGDVTHRMKTVTTRVDEALNPQVMSAVNLVGLGLKAYQIYKESVVCQKSSAKSKQALDRDDFETPSI